MNGVIESLPILILYPHSRCNCRCVMCDIWKQTEANEMTVEDLERHVTSIANLNVQWVILSGGEPLMHSDLFRLCGVLRRQRIRITILSSGLLLGRFASSIVENVDDMIVSLDGPCTVHDEIRRIPGAFDALAAGVQAIHAHRADFPIAARCTVQRRNAEHLRATVRAAKELDLQSISFLAADATSTAFNRIDGWTSDQRTAVLMTDDGAEKLETEIETLIADDECGKFVRESPEKMRRIVNHFRAHLNDAPLDAPKCNAPWVSVVVEADGVVRPCFFHPSIGRLTTTTSLVEVVNGSAAVTFRETLDVATNPICRRCVCSLYRCSEPILSAVQ